MAKMRLTVTVCDVCRNREREAQRYSISFPGDGAHRLDLCEEHAAPLELLRDVKASPRGGDRQVLSTEEFEKMTEDDKKKK